MTDASSQLLQDALHCVRALREELQRYREQEAAVRDPVAIVGMACRFPGAPDLWHYWDLLHQGRCAITETPASRWDIRQLFQQGGGRGRMNTRRGGYLDNPERFDAAFFDLLPREAVAIDPQHRLLLEVTYEALENAGHPAGSLAGSDTGVFVGVATSDFGERLAALGPDVDAYWSTGNARSIAANRLSHTFDLHGPSMAIDTACSSSLTALHLACGSIASGECGTALVAGVNVMFSPAISISFSQAGATSPTGRCRPFDRDADGMVRGEGAGMIVLKPLSRARADGDHVYAVILGSAINQDGRTPGLAAPNPAAQRRVLEDAWRRSRIDAAQLQYIEMHGTGTPLGDPLEVRALGQALAGAGQCRIGSVKSNLGHTEAAAGISGVIKTALAINFAKLPASLGYDRPNPHVDLSRLGIQVQAATGAWPRPDRRRIAGVSGMGFGGANAHVVLAEMVELGAEAPTPVPANDAVPAQRTQPSAGIVVAGPDTRTSVDLVTRRLDAQAPKLVEHDLVLPLSAKDPAALRDLARAYLELIGGMGYEACAELRNLSYTAAARRDHHPHRAALVFGSRDEAIVRLEALIDGTADTRVATGVASAVPAPVLWVFSGHRAAINLDDFAFLAADPVAGKVLAECDAMLRTLAGWSLLERLSPGSAPREIPGEQVDLLHPLLFAYQIATVTLWRHWGIPVQATIGHSVGEIAAAQCAGCLTLSDAMRLVVHRSRLQRAAAVADDCGRMLAVELAPADLRVWLETEPLVTLATHNGPRSVVLAGPDEAIFRLSKRLKQRQVFCRLLEAPGAGHCAAVDDHLLEFAQTIGELAATPPAAAFFSTVSGKALQTAPDLGYWQQNLRQPVRFVDALSAAMDAGFCVMNEVAPYPPALTPMIAQCGQEAGREVVVLPQLRRGVTQRGYMLASLAQLYCAGYRPAWTHIQQDGRHDIRLPTYPWQRQRYWPAGWREMWTGPSHEQANAATAYVATIKSEHPILGTRLADVGGSDCWMWQAVIPDQLPSFLVDHQVQSVPVMAGAAYADLALSAAALVFPGLPVRLEEVRFQAMLSLSATPGRCLRLILHRQDAVTGGFQILSRGVGDDDASWTLHADGRIHCHSAEATEAPPVAIRDEPASRHSSQQAFYDRAERLGAGYYGLFRGINHVSHHSARALATLSLPAERWAGGPHVIHPALLDLCFQSFGATLPDADSTVYVPVGARYIEQRRTLPDQGPLRVLVEPDAPAGPADAALFSGTVMLLDAQDRVCWRVVGLQVRRQALASLLVGDPGVFYHIGWRRQDLIPARRQTPCILFGDTTCAPLLADVLRAQGRQVSVVRMGPARPGDLLADYTIDADNPAAYAAVLSELIPPGQTVDVVHLWSLTPDAGASRPDTTTLLAAQARGVCSLQHLVRTVIERGAEAAVRLTMVTRGAYAVVPGDGVSDLAATPIAGFLRALSLEWPALLHRSLDLCADPAGLAVSVNCLCAEINSNDDGQRVVAERAGIRYVAQLVQREEPCSGRDFLASGVATATTDGSSVRINPAPIDPDGWQIITGGLSGLGLLTAQWLAATKGCRRLALLGRRGPSLEAQAAIDALGNAGVKVAVFAADVADESRLCQVLTSLRSSAPVTGIVHAAGTLDDGLITQLDPSRYHGVMATKLAGAWNLHCLTVNDPIRLFLLYSSIASLFGSPGQANYAAANSFLDGLAQHRHAASQPALSINWGPWGQVGGVARAGGSSRIALAGFDEIEPDLGLAALDRLLTFSAAQAGVARVRWSNVVATFPALAGQRLFATLVDPLRQSGPMVEDRKTRLRALSSEARRSILLGTLREEIGTAVGLPAEDIMPTCVLTEMGIDSLIALETRNRIETKLGLTLPIVKFLDGSTLEQLAFALADSVIEPDTSPAESVSPATLGLLRELQQAGREVEHRLEGLEEADLDRLTSALLAEQTGAGAA